MGTIFEEMEQEWEAKARLAATQGLEKGKAEGLARLLIRRFGPLPQDLHDRITTAELDQLDIWLDAVLDAPDLASVFDTKGHH